MQITAIKVQSDSGKTYSITAHEGGVLFCTCPAWKFQDKPQADRTCKHIDFARRNLAVK